jgi:hypothetical protein
VSDFVEQRYCKSVYEINGQHYHFQSINSVNFNRCATEWNWTAQLRWCTTNSSVLSWESFPNQSKVFFISNQKSKQTVRSADRPHIGRTVRKEWVRHKEKLKSSVNAVHDRGQHEPCECISAITERTVSERNVWIGNQRSHQTEGQRPRKVLQLSEKDILLRWSVTQNLGWVSDGKGSEGSKKSVEKVWRHIICGRGCKTTV